MDILYRIFFIVASLGLMMVVLLPAVLLLRFLLRNRERKYMMFGWKLVYLRSICPLAMTSMLYLVPYLNRRFYLITSGLGLTLENTKGVVWNWREIFTGKISVTMAFRGCSYIWAAGVVLILLYSFMIQYRLHKYLAPAKEIGEDIYESGQISLPVQVGISKRKIYLPKGFQVRETAWLLRHMEKRKNETIRRFLVVLITAIHWFNPVMWLYYYLWNRDNEIAADERLVYKRKKIECLKYAQGILNFRKEYRYQKDASGVLTQVKIQDHFSFLTIYERHTDMRAKRMMYQKWDTKGTKFLSRCFLLASCIVWFFISPISSVWAGGTWNLKQTAEKEDVAPLFEEQENIIIAQTNTMSPDGLERVVQLEMLKGETDQESGYDGTFQLVMYDNLDNQITSIDMDRVFVKNPQSSYHFSQDMTLCIGDYNGDGTQEVVLGQKQALLESEFEALFAEQKDKPKLQDYQVFGYSLINIEDRALTIACDNMIAVTNDMEQTESVTLGTVEDVPGLFYLPMATEKKYYVWKESEGIYEVQNLTEEDVERMKQTDDENDSKAQIGETQEHVLSAEDGSTAVLVSTKYDETSGELIKSVILSPRNHEKKFDTIQGYYCDLFWAPTIGEDTNPYAVLVYNGAKSRTFTIFDTKTKEIYYAHEDGAEGLGKIFEQYNEGDITFEEGGVVLYTLSEKTKDTLKIDFAATADGGITVKGSYEYNVARKTSANLKFTRSIDEDTAMAQPTAEAAD